MGNSRNNCNQLSKRKINLFLPGSVLNTSNVDVKCIYVCIYMDQYLINI